MAVQGSPISTELKQTVVEVKEYFDRTKNDKEEQCLPSVQKTANALGLGIATVKRVMAAYNRNPDFSNANPGYRGRPPRVISESLQTVVRSYIRDANESGRHITLDMLKKYLEAVSPEQSIYTRTLSRTLDRWGFTFGKGTRSQHLKEKDHVIAARHRYLRAKRENRKGNKTVKPEVYLDESYVNKNHSNDFIWYSEEDGPWIQKPTGRGERLIILNAMTAEGWVNNAKFVFKSTKKTGDYHGQMNHELFSKWFEEQLLPNIPKNSLIIMDNASYHNCLAPYSAPTNCCKKEKIKQWLIENKVPIRDDCLKAELIELLKQRTPEPTYIIDEMAKAASHQVIRTPPYHPELQPIETCWGIVKNEIARNCDFTMANLIIQLDHAFEKVTSKTCVGLIKKTRETEDKFWNDELKMEKNA